MDAMEKTVEVLWKKTRKQESHPKEHGLNRDLEEVSKPRTLAMLKSKPKEEKMGK